MGSVHSNSARVWPNLPHRYSRERQRRAIRVFGYNLRDGCYWGVGLCRLGTPYIYRGICFPIYSWWAKNRSSVCFTRWLCELVPPNNGLSLNPLLLKAQFAVIFVGVNLTFFPIHFLGLAGMPRRYSDFPDFYIGFNFLASTGSIISIFRVVLLLYIV